MKLQQLRFFDAICKHNLNVTAASNALFTSQPGVSRQMKMFGMNWVCHYSIVKEKAWFH